MTNEGKVDRVIRVLLGIAVLAAALTVFGLGSLLGIIGAIVAGVLIVTGLVGFCPAYKLVGLSTCPLKTQAS